MLHFIIFEVVSYFTNNLSFLYFYQFCLGLNVNESTIQMLILNKTLETLNVRSTHR